MYDTGIEAVEERKGRQILGFTTRRFGFMFMKAGWNDFWFLFSNRGSGVVCTSGLVLLLYKSLEGCGITLCTKQSRCFGYLYVEMLLYTLPLFVTDIPLGGIRIHCSNVWVFAKLAEEVR